MMDGDKTEFFKSAREELLLRVAARDSWLRSHLTVQFTVIALGLGIPLFETARQDQDMRWLLAVAPFLGLGAYLLYAVEDRLIGHLSHYLRESIPGDHWDRSQSFEEYQDKTLWWRFYGTAFVFISLPCASLLLSTFPWAAKGPGAALFTALLLVLLEANRRMRAP